MNRFTDFLKRHQFLEGVAVGFLACIWIYGTFIKEGCATLKIKYDLMKDDYANKAAFEIKFHESELQGRNSLLKIQDLDKQLNESDRKFTDLRDSRWEEKFNSEKLARISAEEQLASSQGRVHGLASERDQTSKDYEGLKIKLDATMKERDALKRLYEGRTPMPIQSQTSTQQIVQTPRSDALNLLASLAGMESYSVKNYLIEQIPKIKDGIPADIFISMVKCSELYGRTDIVSKCGKYVQRPLTREQTLTISGLLESFEAAGAMKSLTSPQ